MKPKHYLICLLIMFLTLFLSSCAKNVQYKPTIIKAAAGQTFVISLEANHTTGYEWIIENEIDLALLRFIDTKYESSKPGLIGGGGIETWSFEALKAGKAEISFGYVRPWEKEVAPIKGRKFSIEID